MIQTAVNLVQIYRSKKSDWTIDIIFYFEMSGHFFWKVDNNKYKNLIRVFNLHLEFEKLYYISILHINIINCVLNKIFSNKYNNNFIIDTNVIIK